MSITYKILEVTPNRLKVDVGSGQWAYVPIYKGETKDDIEARIRRYGPQESEKPFDSTSDVPLAVDDTATITDLEEEQEVVSAARLSAQENIPIEWETQRIQMYPPVTKQLDALYWSRKGDNTKLELIDSIIDDVKSTIPKNTAAVTAKVWDETYDEGTVADRTGKKKIIEADW